MASRPCKTLVYAGYGRDGTGYLFNHQSSGYLVIRRCGAVSESCCHSEAEGQTVFELALGAANPLIGLATGGGDAELAAGTLTSQSSLCVRIPKEHLIIFPAQIAIK